MESRQRLFRIKFMHEHRQLQIVPSLEKAYDGVVIGKDGLPFTINVACKHGEVVYGSKLFIDGQEVFKSKTFKKAGNFFGFRTQAVGQYQQFLFAIPEFQRHQMIEANKTAIEIKERGCKMGEIKIVFFESQEKWVKENARKPATFKSGPAFVPVSTSDCKSVGARSLSVTTGKEFNLGKGDKVVADRINKGKENRYDEKSGMMKIDQTDFDKVIDQVVIRYSSIAALLGLSILSPFNPLHLQYFPQEVLQEHQFINGIILQEILLGAPGQRLAAGHLEEAYLQSVKRPFKEVMKRPVEEFCAKIALFAVENRKGATVVSIRNQDRVATKDELIKKVLDGEFHQFCVHRPGPDDHRQPDSFLGKRNQAATNMPSNERANERRVQQKENKSREAK